MKKFHLAYGRWEQSICRANRCTEQSHTLLALFYFQQAIQHSDHLISIKPLSRQSISAMLVSHHKLAELYEQHRACRAAWQHYQSACVTMENSVRVHGEQPVIVWGSQVANSKLHSFEKQYGVYGGATSENSARTRQVAFVARQPLSAQ